MVERLDSTRVAKMDDSTAATMVDAWVDLRVVQTAAKWAEWRVARWAVLKVARLAVCSVAVKVARKAWCLVVPKAEQKVDSWADSTERRLVVCWVAYLAARWVLSAAAAWEKMTAVSRAAKRAD